MITRPTVFILGAGASVPFGFPTGAGLRRLICELPRVGNSRPRDLLRNCLHYPETAYREFCDAFMYSGLASIDAFLGRRTEFEEIGKATIAACIAHFEQPGALTAVNNTFGSSDWYGELWNRMMEGVNSVEELQKNTIAFVTFNYDRSLEAFLHSSIKNTFGLDDQAAESAWSDFPIHHVYGSLGVFRPSQGERFGLPDAPDSREAFLTNASSSIHVVPTARGAPKDRRAMDIIAANDVVALLGFGFDETNCRRLSLAEALQRRGRPDKESAPVVHMTVLDLTGAEITRGLDRLLGAGAQRPDVRAMDADCLESLRSWLPDLTHSQP